MRTAIAISLLLSATARADTGFDPLVVQVGLGVALRADHDTTVDGTLRLGKTWFVEPDAYLGGFAEIHTFGFASVDAAIGPQAQLALGDIARLQLRAGVGTGTDGALALAGLQLSHIFVGASVTGRRDFTTGELAVSVDVEVLPFMIFVANVLGIDD